MIFWTSHLELKVETWVLKEVNTLKESGTKLDMEWTTLDKIKWIKDDNLEYGKFLGTPVARRNSAPSSHIHDGPHNKFNEWTPP